MAVSSVSVDAFDLTFPLNTPNYSNIGNVITPFFVSGDVVFYEDYTSFEQGVSIMKDELRACLIPSGLFRYDTLHSLLVAGDRVYASYSSGESIASFYYYDFKTLKAEHLMDVQGAVMKWIVTEDFLAYSLYFDEDDRVQPLYIYSIATGDTTLIAEEIEDFSVVDGNLRYIVYDRLYRVLEYDVTQHTNKSLCQYEGYSIKLDKTYQFTKDRVVLYRTDGYEVASDTEWKVVDLATGEVQTFELPYPSFEIVVGDRYAYIQTFQTDDDESASAISLLNESDTFCPIYRVDLETGKYTVLPITEDEFGEFYVASDDILYLLQHDWTFFSPEGETITVYDVPTNTKGTQWKLNH